MKYIKFTVLALLLLSGMISRGNQHIGKETNVLVLHSYNPGLVWTESIHSGIELTLSLHLDNIAIATEYFDSKRLFDLQYQELQYNLLYHKYTHRNVLFDVIIISDDDALRFLMRYGDKLFPGVPIVFCGVNDYSPALLADFPHITGVVENVDMKITLETGLSLFPQVNHVVVIGDSSTTALDLSHIFRQTVEPYFPETIFKYIHEPIIENTKPKLKALGDNSLVLLLPYVSFDGYRIMEFEETAHFASHYSPAPVMGLWEFALGQGIVGGKLVSGYQQGKMAAEIAARILLGEKPYEIPVVTDSPNRFFFDYEALDRFEIATYQLPEGSLVVNKPPTVWQQHRDVLPLIIAVIGIALLVLFTLMIREKYLRRVLQNKLKYRQTLINALPNPVFYCDNKGMVVGCNVAFESITGLKHAEIAGKQLTRIYIPEQLEYHLKQNENILHKRINIKSFEGKLVGADNKIFDVLFYKALLPGNKMDKGGMIETIIDVTERNSAYETLRQSEERYSLATKATKDGIWDLNLKTNNFYASARFMEILGYEPQEKVVDIAFFEKHIFPSDLQLLLFQLQLIKERVKDSFKLELRLSKQDGESLWSSLSVFGIWDSDGEIMRMVGAIADIQERKNNETILKKWEHIFTNTNIGIAISNSVDDKLTLLNPHFARLLGYEISEINNNTFLEFIEPNYKESFAKVVERAYKVGNENTESVCVRKDGSTFPVSINMTSVNDKRNKPLYLIINLLDITIRKAQERKIEIMLQNEQAINEELRSQEEEIRQTLEQTIRLKDNIEQHQKQYQFFLNGTTDYTILKDCDLKYLHVNRAYADFYNLPTEDFAGKTDFDFLSPERAQKIMELDRRVINEKTLLTFEDEYRGQFFETRKFPVSYEQNKIGVGTFIRNITKQKLIEQQIQKNELRFRTLLENAYDAIIMVDQDGIIKYSTDVIEKITGIPLPKVIGKNIRQMVVADDRLYFEEKLSYVINHPGESTTMQYSLKSKDGAIKYIESVAVNHLDNPLLGSILITSRDISHESQAAELKRNVEIAERSAMIKQQFLSNMSHEIRTPMNGIVGMIEFLSKTNLDENQRDYVETIKESTESLLFIINDILDLSKIEAGKMTLIEVPNNIHKFASNVRNLFIATARQKNLEFNIVMDNTVPEILYFDSVRLNQVISNLVSNAIKFTQSGGVTLKFTNLNIADNTIDLKIEVIDTGVGIKPDDHKKLFSAFSQIDSSITRSAEGTGLGLAISHKMVDLMGGKLNVESNFGEGSKFWFVIQLKIALDEAIIVSKPSDNRTISKKLNLSILLVEDKPVNQKVIKLMLTNMGCTVTMASNGKEALELVEEAEKNNVSSRPVFDVILMDIHMPVMDGITATRLIKEQFPGYNRIIGLSANAIASEVDKYLRSGLDDYIIKPARSEDLYFKLEKWKPE